MLTKYASLIIVKTLLVVTLFALVAVGLFVNYNDAQAVSEQELRNQASAIQAEIEENEKVLESLDQKANTLEKKLQQLSTEISRANNEIRLTEVKIAELEAEIEKTEKELDRQKGILADNLKELYKSGTITTIEMLASSDSFSDFINAQEYLERLKVAIQESADRVEALKDELEVEKNKKEDQLESQQDQKKVLAIKKQEQSDLLTQTRGQEAKYQKIVNNLEAERAAALKQLENFLRARNYTTIKVVTSGIQIGKVGSSGFSTGPHLHFAVYDDGQFVNPVAAPGVLINGFKWPLPNSNWSNVSQGFGCIAPYDWYSVKCPNGMSMHQGLDITGWYGDPVEAAAPGNVIFHGYMGGYGNTVIIDHGGGLFTYYPHLLE